MKFNKRIVFGWNYHKPFHKRRAGELALGTFGSACAEILDWDLMYLVGAVKFTKGWLFLWRKKVRDFLPRT